MRIKSPARKGAKNKENKHKNVFQTSLAPVQTDLEVSDSYDNLAFQPIMVKRPAAKTLPFGNSPNKKNPSVMRTQSKGHIRQPYHDPLSAMNLWKAAIDRHKKLRAYHALHQSAVYGAW